MMFAQSLTAYEEAFDDFYRALDQIEERLSVSRFLFGDYVTDSDVRLFVTLARFDTHYYRNLGPLNAEWWTTETYGILKRFICDSCISE